MKTPTLQTERLILRPISLDDAPDIQTHFNDWNIIKHMNSGVPWPYPDDGAFTFLRDRVMPNVKAGKENVWAITLKQKAHTFIGAISFGIQRGSREDRGFWLASKYHGYGFMTEAVAVINDFVFDELKLKKFKVTNAKSNIASRRVKEKTGAIFVRMEKGEHNSGDTDSEVWEVTKESWAAAKILLKT